MNKAIVICYTGKEPDSDTVYGIHQAIESYCNGEGITIKVFDSDSIAKALLKKSAEDMKISFTGDSDVKQSAGTVYITFNPKDCEQKLRVIKHIKESLDCSIKEAKDMVDCGKVYIPQLWDNLKIYNFIKGLCANKVTAIGGMEDIAMIQAGIFLNETYHHGIDLVKDFAAATYHSHTNSADQEEQALLTAVELVKNDPKSAAKWVYSELIDVINSL